MSKEHPIPKLQTSSSESTSTADTSTPVDSFGSTTGSILGVLGSLFKSNPQTGSMSVSIEMNLVEMIELIKGNRTLKQFGEDTHIGTATLSKILNGKYTPGIKLLEKMISPDSSPQFAFTLEQLVTASKGKFILSSKSGTKSFEERALSAIRNKLKIVSEENSSRFSFDEYFSLISYNAVSPDKIYKVNGIEWWFYFIDDKNNSDARSNYEKAKSLLSRTVLAPANSNRKISFVTNNWKLFIELYKFTQFNSIRANLSTIFLAEKDSIIFSEEERDNTSFETLDSFSSINEPLSSFAFIAEEFIAYYDIENPTKLLPLIS